MTSEAATVGQVPQTPAGRIPRQAGRTRPTGPKAFTRWVEQRCAADPGVRAALRQGAGKGLNQVPSMHRFVAPWLPTDAGQDVQRAYYAVAAMIAAQRRSQYTLADLEEIDGSAESVAGAHTCGAAGAPHIAAAAEAPGSGGTPNAGRPGADRPVRWSLGRSFAEAVASGGMRESSAETRLNLLARQSVEGLLRHLPGAVRQLREAGARVDWSLLLVDLYQWRQYGGPVKRYWLQDFYRARHRAGLQAAMDSDEATGVAEAPAPPSPPAP
ncbi:type I-E CRISPR-associated protein Cse2/CasB [Kitasatospora sp. NPDC059673]|uniref:type I-E CRISPR-associated protein Cse2/CasB n=1 Tax=Kitasatospora sp. NPDC059673 TaxID=3346901 RepID=UPI0036A78E97